jgi:hypothetical protein
MDLKSPDFEEMRLQFEAEAIKHIEDEKKMKKKRNITKIGKTSFRSLICIEYIYLIAFDG